MISEGFVHNGATVYISSRDAKACEQACKELNALGKGKADFIAADLYKEDAAKNIADELKKRAGSTSNHGSRQETIKTNMHQVANRSQSLMSSSTTAVATGASPTTTTQPQHGTVSSISTSSASFNSPKPSHPSSKQLLRRAPQRASSTSAASTVCASLPSRHSPIPLPKLVSTT
jgi:hypothetical protein